jgi:hypothetical protein
MKAEELEYRALEMIDIDETRITGIKQTENYPIIIELDNGKELHFFLFDEYGVLFYDGWDKEGVCTFDLCEN